MPGSPWEASEIFTLQGDKKAQPWLILPQGNVLRRPSSTRKPAAWQVLCSRGGTLSLVTEPGRDSRAVWGPYGAAVVRHHCSGLLCCILHNPHSPQHNEEEDGGQM